MTKTEYENKLARYQTSTAPIAVKEAAIKKLQAIYYKHSNNKELHKQIIEGEADISDIGGF